MIELREMSIDEVWEGCDIKLGTIDADDWEVVE